MRNVPSHIYQAEHQAKCRSISRTVRDLFQTRTGHQRVLRNVSRWPQERKKIKKNKELTETKAKHVREKSRRVKVVSESSRSPSLAVDYSQ